MKTKILFALLFVSSNFLYAQNNMRLDSILFYPAQNNTVLPNYNMYRVYEYPNINTDLPSSITHYSFDNTLSAFAPVFRNIFAYNLAGLVVENLNEVWENNQWKPFRKYTYSYDGNNQLITENQYGWTGSNWLEYHRSLYGYDSFGYLSQHTEMDTVNGILRNKERTLWSYQSNGLLAIWQKEIFYNNNWKTSEYEEYYMSLNPMRWDSTIVMILPTPASQSLIHTRTYYYTYNNLWQIIERKDKTISNNFIQQRYVYEYEPNGGLKIRDERQFWNQDSAKFIPADGQYYTYDNQQRILTYKIKQGNQDIRIEETNYATDSSVISTTLQQFDFNNAVLNLTGRTDYIFKSTNTTSVKDLGKTANITAFPNPFTTHATLQFNAEEYGTAQIIAFDVNGRLVSVQNTKVQAGSNAVSWHAVDLKGNTLPSGFYTLQITNGSTKYSFRLIKQ